MNILKLYKNENLVFEKEGKIQNNMFYTDNIQLDIINYILIREDKDFKYELNYKLNQANINLKQQNYDITINIDTKNIVTKDNYLEINYSIASEEEVNNTIILTFE